MRRACWLVLLVACSSATATLDGGDPNDATVDAAEDHAIGNPLDATKPDASADVIASDVTTADVADSGVADVTDASSALAFDLDALAYCAQWSCSWTDAWPSAQLAQYDAAQPISGYACVQCVDHGSCNPYPWANGCDAGTVYDPVISPFDGASSVLDFCVPESCPPK